MGYYVYLQVSWGGGEPDEVSPLAMKHASAVAASFTDPVLDWEQAVLVFLRDVGSGKAYFGGSKGDFWVWGTIGNYLSVDKFVEYVKPFFTELYGSGILPDHHRVVFMCEKEQSETVAIRELGCNPVPTLFNKGIGGLYVKNHSSEGKWCWGQM
jgi:hypothetical protein